MAVLQSTQVTGSLIVSGSGTLNNVDFTKALGGVSGSFSGSFQGLVVDSSGTPQTPLYKANNLSDVQDVQLSRFNLGLGTGSLVVFGGVDTAGLSATSLGITGESTFTGAVTVNGNTKITGSLDVSGAITALEFHSQFVSSSIVYESGSTKFGDTSDDKHTMTGSLGLQGSEALTANLSVGGQLSVTGSTYLGTVSAGTWNGSTIGVQYGGTGTTSLTSGSLVVGNGTSAVTLIARGSLTNGSSKVSIVNGNAVLIGQNASIDIVEGNISINNLSGTLSVSNGGTGTTSLTSGSLVTGNGTSAVSLTSRGTITSGSTKLSVSGGGGASVGQNVTIDVVESNISITNLSGTLTVPKGGTGVTSITSGSILTGNGNSAITTTSRGTITSGSTKVTISGGGGASLGQNVTIDIAESNLTLNNIGGTLNVNKGGTGATTLTGIVKGNGTSAFTAVTGTNNTVVKWTSSGNSLGNSLFSDNGTTSGVGSLNASYYFYVDGSMGVNGKITELSTIRIKKNITPLKDSLDRVSRLRGVEFDRKDTNEHQIGLIAEEVNEIYPYLTTKDRDGSVSGVQYQRIVAVLIEAVKELNSKLNAQQELIDELRSR